MRQVFIPIFPGTNCEKETFSWVSRNLEVSICSNHSGTGYLGESEIDRNKLAAIIVPGGFTFGDYLRAGAIAAQSKSIELVRNAAAQGVPILGICNGFQILCEAKILPGALSKNTCKHHLHGTVQLALNRELANPLNTSDKSDSQASSPLSVWFPKLAHSRLSAFFASVQLPISCGMGAYVLPKNIRQEMGVTLENPRPRYTRFMKSDPVKSDQSETSTLAVHTSLFAKCMSQGFVPILHYVQNEPGSQASIAAVVSSNGKILGMMPHPERASDILLGEDAGLIFLLGLALSQDLPIRPGSPLAYFAESLTGENLANRQIDKEQVNTRNAAGVLKP